MSKSLITDNYECFVCHTTRNLHKHHIFGGAGRRQLSEKFGCWVYLCAYHHNMSNNGVHFDATLATKLKKFCQKKFEEQYSREEFRHYFGRSYLDD